MKLEKTKMSGEQFDGAVFFWKYKQNIHSKWKLSTCNAIQLLILNFTNRAKASVLTILSLEKTITKSVSESFHIIRFQTYLQSFILYKTYCFVIHCK